ncbi:MAG: TVP38/TMEM64 family protein [Elusimicrobia bacterium]|nr:TVP38/TMEM64 family protein [Elusimicrobiota bacterium]
MSDLLRGLLERVSALGLWAPAAFVALYAAAAVLMVPGSLLTLGAGAVFGPVKGAVLVWLAATLGSTLAFAAGRTIARGLVSRRLGADPRLAAVDAAISRDGWRVVLLLRLSPLFPYNALNYVLSLTGVTARDYVSATALGMIPGTLLYVYIGSLAGGVAGLGGARTRTPLEWLLYAAGFAATIGAAVLVGRSARRSLDESLGGAR